MSPDQKEWTVMVYLAGDNDLDEAGVTDLKEMKKVGSTPEIDVVAQVDRFGGGHATKRYHLRKGTQLESDTEESLGETNMGDPKVLEDFLRWGMQKYPARRFLVVLWNHGSGWDDEDIYRTARGSGLGIRRRGEVVDPSSAGAGGTTSVRRLRTVGTKRFRRALFEPSIARAIQPGDNNRAIAFDDTSKDFLDNIEMKKVLSRITDEFGRPIDILGMDACLMSMAEVAYQIRETALVTVGSEEVEPSDGWPYDTILEELAANPQMTPENLGEVIVKNYLAAYGDDANVTQASCDLAKCGALAQSVDRLAKAMASELSERSVFQAILESRSQVQSYDVAEYVDLYNFCELLVEKIPPGDLRTATEGVLDAIREPAFVLTSGYKGRDMENSNGVAIYFPVRKISPLYETLDFAKDTAWHDFLQAYAIAVRQPPRHTGRRSGTRPSPERGAEV